MDLHWLPPKQQTQQNSFLERSFSLGIEPSHYMSVEIAQSDLTETKISHYPISVPWQTQMKCFNRTNLKVDLDQYHPAVTGLDIKPRVLSSSPVAVTMDSIDYGDMFVRFTRFKGSLMEEYSAKPDWLTISIPIHPVRWCGHQRPPYAAALITPHRDCLMVISGSLELLELCYTRDALREVGLSLDSITDTNGSPGKQSYSPIDGWTVAWVRKLVYGDYSSSQHIYEVREQLLGFLREWFSSPSHLHRVNLGTQRMEITQAVIQLVDAHPQKFFSIEDLSSTLGVSECWLRRSFKSTMGMNVYQYIRETKLTAAHDLLRTRSENVTTVATHFGFNHLSRFSKYYHARFGELPSQTLKNTRSTRG